MNIKDELPMPSEPIEIKKQMIDVRIHFGNGDNIDWDSQAVWFRNALPTYLWNEWKIILVDYGFTWPKFLKYIKYYTHDMIRWMREKITWEELIQKLKDSIDD